MVCVPLRLPLGVDTNTHTHACARARARAHTHTHTYIYIHTSVRTPRIEFEHVSDTAEAQKPMTALVPLSHVCEHVRVCSRYTHPYIHARELTHIHATCTCIHASTRAHAHTRASYSLTVTHTHRYEKKSVFRSYLGMSSDMKFRVKNQG